MKLILRLLNRKNELLCESISEDRVGLVYKPEYRDGDWIQLCCERSGFYELRLEDTLPPTIVYIHSDNPGTFIIPAKGSKRTGYSPRSFHGIQHFIGACAANPDLVYARRNLALNPYDTYTETGIYPHVTTNAVTPHEPMSAPRNAIDGLWLNSGRQPYPYQSWGGRMDPDTRLKLEFGTAVDLDSLVLILRAAYPHDNFWKRITVAFSDGSEEVLSTAKSPDPQTFPLTKRGITWLMLKQLIPSEDSSPHYALTQIEAWGRVSGKPV